MSAPKPRPRCKKCRKSDTGLYRARFDGIKNRITVCAWCLADLMVDKVVREITTRY